MSPGATTPPTVSEAALSDVHARPRTGWVVQSLAILLTAAPVIGVGLWSLVWAL